MAQVYQSPSVEEIKAALTSEFPQVEIISTAERRVKAKCPREISHDVCQFIHDNLTFEHCSVVTAVDYIDHLMVVYLLSNYYNGVMIDLDVDVPDDDLHIQAVTDIWEGANWHERETWELFGIVFDGHPRLERLLTPQNYEFFPFRKSYKLRSQE
jgi:NADH-quinone oxidoreductase subunit C